MKWNEFYEKEMAALGEDLIVEAMECNKVTVELKAHYVESRPNIFKNIMTAAACILLAVAMTVSFVLMRRSITPGGQPTTDTETETNEPETDTNKFEESSEMNYLSTDEWDYFVTEDGAVLIGYHGDETEVTVPSVIEGIPVYTLKQRTIENEMRGVFYDTDVTHVTIPGAISVIGQGAFRNSPSVVSITVENGVEMIEKYAFCGSEIEYLYLPDSVEYIGIYAFGFCHNLKSIDMGRNVRTIREAAFAECCALESIALPGSLTRISRSTFYNCTSLGAVVIPEGINKIDEYAFNGCSSLASIAIPSTVESIERCAFSECGLRRIKLNEGLKVIGDCAFDRVLVSELVIPDGVEEIGDSAFAGASNLQTISLPKSLVSVGDRIFNNCAYDIVISFNGTVEDLVAYGFDSYDWGTDIFKIEFDEGYMYESSGGFMFFARYSEDKTLIVSISGYDGSETELVIPSEIGGLPVVELCAKRYGNANFGRLVKKIVVPDSVTTVGSGAFSNMPKLEEVYLGNGVSRIENNMFEHCQSLRKVVWGDSVSDIGDSAFFGCGSLEEIEIGANVKIIGKSAFRGCRSLTKVTFNGELSSIGYCAFAECKSLKEVTIPYVVEVGQSIFSDCTALETVTIGGEWYKLPTEMFFGCSALATVNLPSVHVIGERAFCGCASLTELIIPGVVYVEGDFVINDSAFSGSGIKEIYFPESEVYVDVGEIYWEEYYDDWCC